MSRTLFSIATAVVVSAVALAGTALAKDVAGSKDHPLVGRYIGSEITAYTVSDFDAQQFLKTVVDFKVDGEAFTDRNSYRVEGKITRIRYEAPKDRSSLEIIRNFEDSLKSKGFEVVHACADAACAGNGGSPYRMATFAGDGQINYRYGDGVRYVLAKATRPSGDVHAAVFVGESKSGPLVRVIVAEEKPMQGDRIAFIDAGAMSKAIAAQGHVALYGIQFDFDKAEIRPESRPTLDEIAKFLKAEPSISVVVAGHTDAKGAFDYNVDLSRRRAAAVVADLTGRYGIAAQRLTPFGAGMAAPIAGNDDEAGRTKNRRVELVRR